MQPQAILMRVLILAAAIGLTVGLLEFWGMAAGVMGHYLSDKPAANGDGIVTVQILPSPKNPPPK